MRFSKDQPFCAWICLLMMLCTSQIHLAALQGIAWAGMAVAYSQDSGDVADGVKRTLSGDEPCSLCCAVQEAAREENPADSRPPSPEIRNFLLARAVSISPPLPRHGGWVLTNTMIPPVRVDEVFRPPS